MKMLKDRDKRLRLLDAKIAVEPPDRAELREALEQGREDWRAVLRANVTQTRAVLQQLIALPLVVEPTPTPAWVAKARPSGLLVGLTATIDVAEFLPANAPQC